MTFVHLHDHIRLTSANRRQVRLPVPAIERSMVAALATRGEDQVVADLVTPTETVCSKISTD